MLTFARKEFSNGFESWYGRSSCAALGLEEATSLFPKSYYVGRGIETSFLLLPTMLVQVKLKCTYSSISINDVFIGPRKTVLNSSSARIIFIQTQTNQSFQTAESDSFLLIKPEFSHISVNTGFCW
jgi:hypothetical protein